MANGYEDRELDAARESLKSLTDKGESLRASGGNLDRNGEPSLTASRGGPSFTPSSSDSSAAARKSLRGADALDMGPQLDKRKKDSRITGQVGGRAVRRQKPMSWAEPEGPKKPEEASRR